MYSRDTARPSRPGEVYNRVVQGIDRLSHPTCKQPTFNTSLSRDLQALISINPPRLPSLPDYLFPIAYNMKLNLPLLITCLRMTVLGLSFLVMILMAVYMKLYKQYDFGMYVSKSHVPLQHLKR